MNFIFFMLFGMIFLKLTACELEIQHNRTDYMSQLESRRSKRSLSARMPRILTFQIEDLPGEKIDVRLIKTDQLLANEYLPVVVSGSNIAVDVMKRLGGFVMYQDKTTCSAIVYFEKSKALYGVVGTDHHIQHLALLFDEKGEYQLGKIADPYVKRRRCQSNHINTGNIYPPPSDTNAWEDFLSPLNYKLDNNLKRTADSDAGSSAKHQRTDQESAGRFHEADLSTTNLVFHKKIDPRHVKYYYLETLIFVTRDIVEIFKNHFGESHYIEGMVRYYITYFNAVDMIVQKIATQLQTLYINIAKIVLETDEKPFEFIRNDDLQFTRIIGEVPQYLRAHQYEYPPDSFDWVFIHTGRVIMDDIVAVDGISKYGDNLYEARKSYQFYNAVPITIVRYKHIFGDYMHAVHEIGRILNIKPDFGMKGLTFRGQCYGVMQRNGPKCIDCLKWSDDSIRQYDEFFSTNRNRCFLLNEPRSLRRPGPSRFLTPQRQCLCFGYHSYNMCRDKKPARKIPISQCSGVLQCQIVDGLLVHAVETVQPFDGTPCASGKVCWQGQCTDI